MSVTALHIYEQPAEAPGERAKAKIIAAAADHNTRLPSAPNSRRLIPFKPCR